MPPEQNTVLTVPVKQNRNIYVSCDQSRITDHTQLTYVASEPADNKLETTVLLVQRQQLEKFRSWVVISYRVRSQVQVWRVVGLREGKDKYVLSRTLRLRNPSIIRVNYSNPIPVNTQRHINTADGNSSVLGCYFSFKIGVKGILRAVHAFCGLCLDREPAFPVFTALTQTQYYLKRHDKRKLSTDSVLGIYSPEEIGWPSTSAQKRLSSRKSIT